MSARDGWEDRFKRFLTDYLVDAEGLDVRELLSAYEETFNMGYCETCSYEETFLVVSYRDTSGEVRVRNIQTSFAELFGF